MKTFNKIFLGIFLFAVFGVISNLVSSYSTYGAPSEFGNASTTTCYVGGDDGDITCSGTYSGTIAWANLSSYPAGCPDGSAITNLSDSTTCIPFPDTNCTNDNSCPLITYESDSLACTRLTGNTSDLCALADSDTTYTASGTLLDLTSEVFSVNAGTLTDERICEYESTGTQLECTLVKDGSGACAGGAVCLGGHTHSYLTSLVGDTSPQLGGYLDTNAQNIGSTSDEIENIYITTNYKIYLGTTQQAEVYYDGSALVLKVN